MAFKLNSKMLRDAAYELGLTTHQLARESGVPQPTVSAILLGRRSPAAEKLKAICTVLDLDMSEVFTTAEEAEKMRLAA